MAEFIQFHLLTSYPPANLNRDDLGRPKTAMLGGTQRLRVSSQSLKRAWRTSEVFVERLKGHIGTRTKDLGNHCYKEFVKRKVDPDRADAAAKKIAEVFGKLKGSPTVSESPEEGSANRSKKGKARTLGEDGAAKAASNARQIEQLAHISAAEWASIETLIRRIAENSEPSEKDYTALLTAGHGSADIALFGRMLADSPAFNIEAAAQVAHGISVHRVTIEDDYFTAVDDLNRGEEDMGAGHIGTTEFAAGLFYLYLCVNRSLLIDNLDGNAGLASLAVRAVGEACATVAPSGKQNSFASRARASYMLAERGDQQPRSLAVAFLRAVAGEDMLAQSIEVLQQTCGRMDAVYGQCARDRRSFDAHAGTGTLAEVLDFIGT